MSKPTQKDAELMIRLETLRRSPDMMESGKWLMGLKEQSYEDFIEENPVGSDGWMHFYSIASFFEVVGALVRQDTINENLVLNTWGIPWDKLGPIVKGFQKARGRPKLYENFEYLAKKKADWIKEQPPLFQQ